MENHRHSTGTGLDRHRRELAEFLTVLERLACAAFPPHEWAYGDDRDAAEIYVGDMRGAIVGSAEDVGPSALDRLRDALVVSRGVDAGREAARRIRRPVEVMTKVGSYLVSLVGCGTRSGWDRVTTSAPLASALAGRISGLEIEWAIARRELLQGASFVTELLASLPDRATEGAGSGPRRVRKVRVLVDSSSFRTPTGTPRDTGRVRVRVEVPGDVPVDTLLSRAHHATLSKLSGGPRRITVTEGKDPRSTARDCAKRLRALGLAVSRPAAGRITELESADDIELVRVPTLVDPERGLRRFIDAGRGQEMRGEL